MRKILVLALLVTLAGCGDTKDDKDKKKSDADKDKSASVTPTEPNNPVSLTEDKNQEKEKDQEKESDASDQEKPKTIAAAPIIPMTAKSDDQDQEAEESDDADPTVASIIKKFETGMNDFMKKYRAASDDEKQKLVEEDLPKADEYAEQIMELVNADPKSEESAKGLLWIVQNSRGESNTQATDALLEHHLDSEVMADLAARKSRATPTEEEQKFLKELIAKSPVERVKGVASYALVMQMKSAERTFKYYRNQLEKAEEEAGDDEESDAVSRAQKGYDQFVKDLTPDALAFLETGKTTDGADFETMLEGVNEKYSDVVLSTRGDKTILIGDRCESTLFEIRNLMIGKTAPDIEGEDLDGEAFKLSDYRGKVVVIDFWGDW